MKDYKAIGKKISAAKTRHGLSHTKIHNTWSSMRQRCLDPNNRRWASYGGRGIRIDPRWSVFENFLADVGFPPTIASQLDRIDNDGHYEPGNVRWATPAEQARNRSDNTRLTFEGETLTLSEWARRKGLKVQTLWKRLNNNGWTVSRALSEPVRK